MDFDINMTDELLATTRAVRKRLDLDRTVPRELIETCIDLSQQAPTGGNAQSWRWIVVDDADKRAALADIYRKAAEPYLAAQGEAAVKAGDRQTMRVFESAKYLADNLQDCPCHVIPCLNARPPEGAPLLAVSAMMGSIYPAVWSFQLALRARGLGSCITTLHLPHEQEAAELLGLPAEFMQVALLPVAYTRGTDFKRASRPPVDSILHWNSW